MRILHTSDWHLGKRLFKLDRSDEHQLFLSWLLQTLKEKKIDILLIAGDIFDTPTPPHQSLETFYHFLHQVSVETETDTFIIAGNHDSGQLLEAPALILKSHRVKVWGKLSQDPKNHWVKLQKGRESLSLCALPFFRSFELLPHGEGDALTALKTYLTPEGAGPRLLMLHHLAGSFKAAGSEQVISLTGLESIPSEVLNTFDYVAMGHIHKPQKASVTGYYSGSPLPMRFSEIHPKSVNLVEVVEGKIKVNLLPIPCFRDLLVVKADESNWREKLMALEGPSELTPMVEVQLQLTSPKIGLIDEMKKIIEGKGMELLSFLPFYQAEEKEDRRSEKVFELSPLDLFCEFYAAKFPEATEIPEDLKKDFAKLLEEAKNATASS